VIGGIHRKKKKELRRVCYTNRAVYKSEVDAEFDRDVGAVGGNHKCKGLWVIFRRQLQGIGAGWTDGLPGGGEGTIPTNRLKSAPLFRKQAAMERAG